VIVFAAVAMLLSACGDDRPGGNGCPTSLVESNGQLICPSRQQQLPRSQ